MLITTEQVEESVRDSEENQLSSTRDLKEDESSSIGMKTDGESRSVLIEKLLHGHHKGKVSHYYR